MVRCAGVDGCPAGWVVASDDGAHVVTNLAEVLERFDIVAIDIPIGLPERCRRGADIAARRLVSPRGATVFPALLRPLLELEDYHQANQHSRALTGRGLSKQAFQLRTRILEVDVLMSPGLEDRVVEVHPECSFRVMAGTTLASKHTKVGLRQRHELITRFVGPVPTRPAGARADDVLDAHAALWSARRFAHGQHLTLPDGCVERDGRGLLMRIVV